MKTIKTIASALIISTCFSATVLAGEFPPPPQNTDNVTINNNTSDPINWNYQATFGACGASPSSGNLSPDQQGAQSQVTCSWTAQGQFDVYNQGQLIGAVNAGYGPCQVLSGNGISVNPSAGDCQIFINKP